MSVWCFVLIIPSRLPHAPSMKIYCVYGHGKETEASSRIVVVCMSFVLTMLTISDRTGKVSAVHLHVHFISCSLRYARGEYQFETVDADVMDPICSNTSTCLPPLRPSLDMPLSRKSWIDIEVSADTSVPKVCSVTLRRTSALMYET